MIKIIFSFFAFLLLTIFSVTFVSCANFLEPPPSGGSHGWVSSFDSEDSKDDLPRFIQVDALGRVYVAGTTGDDPSTFDLLILKYDANGALKWVIQGVDQQEQCRLTPTSFFLDEDSSSYAGGKYCCSKTNDSDNCSFAIFKFDPKGEQLWKYEHPFYPVDDLPSVMGMDDSENVVALYTATESSSDFCSLLKIDGQGVLQWQEEYPGYDDDLQAQCLAMKIDEDGNIFAAGHANKIQNSVNDDNAPLSESGGNDDDNDDDDDTGDLSPTDFLLIKYDTDGALLWEAQIDGESMPHDQTSSMTIDDHGSIYLAGQSTDLLGHGDISLIKFDQQGNLTWRRSYDGQEGLLDIAGAVGVDWKGEVTLSGCSESSETLSDFVTVKYNSEGQLLWVRNFNGERSLYDYPRAMKVDEEGGIFVAGISCGSYSAGKLPDTFGCEYYNWQNMANAGCEKGIYALVTIKYSPDGQTEWVEVFDKTGTNDFAALTVDKYRSDTVLVAGSTEDDDSEDVITISYDQDGGDSDNGDPLCCGGCF